MAEHIVHTGKVTADLAQIMQGRDTRFYHGYLAKLTAIIVSTDWDRGTFSMLTASHPSSWP